MRVQSTNFSQKLKYKKILSVLIFCSIAGSLLTAPNISTQANSYSNSTDYSTSVVTSTLSIESQNIKSDRVNVLTTSSFEGELSRKENNTIFISKDNQVKQFTVSSDIKIKRDSVESNINMLKVGDILVINQSQDGQKIFSIEATSKQNSDLIKWVIIGAILTVILAFLLAYFLTKSKRGHIYTSTSTRK